MNTDSVFKSLQFGTRFDKSKFKKDFDIFDRKSEVDLKLVFSHIRMQK